MLSKHEALRREIEEAEYSPESLHDSLHESLGLDVRSSVRLSCDFGQGSLSVYAQIPDLQGESNDTDPGCFLKLL